MGEPRVERCAHSCLGFLSHAATVHCPFAAVWPVHASWQCGDCEVAPNFNFNSSSVPGSVGERGVQGRANTSQSHPAYSIADMELPPVLLPALIARTRRGAPSYGGHYWGLNGLIQYQTASYVRQK